MAIVAKLSGGESLRGNLCGAESLSGELTFSSTGFDLFDGSYIVDPKLEAQTMPTKGKVMGDDVTINKIPITVVSNASGGNTVIIGG